MLHRSSLIFTILPFSAFLSGYLVLNWYYTDTSSKAPTLIGLSLSDGLSLLSQNRLNARVIAFVQDDGYEPGTIIEQKPRPGKSIKAHQSVLLTIVAEKKVISLPDLHGKKIDEASALVEKLGLYVFAYPLRSSLPSNVCIGQWPSPLTLMSPSDCVIVYYAQQQDELLLLPSFIGRSIENVLVEIQEHNGVLECIEEKTGAVLQKNGTLQGTIVDQKPHPGTLINKNEQTMLYLTIRCKGKNYA